MTVEQIQELREQAEFLRGDGNEERALQVESHMSELQAKLDSGNF
jgi:hypothetical protein